MILTIFSKLQGWRKILHLIFSLNHDDNMPLSLKCIASTSDAIFWCGTLAPLFPVVQPIKDVFADDESKNGLTKKTSPRGREDGMGGELEPNNARPRGTRGNGRGYVRKKEGRPRWATV